MTYELILLDADGTLFDYDRAEKYAIETTFRDFGLDYSDAILARYRVVNDALWKELERGNITSGELRVERFRRLLAEIREADAEALSRRYLHHLARGSYLIDGAEDICRYMAQRYSLAILTNGIAEVQRSRLAKSALHGVVSHIIISEEVGLSKPDPRIFEYAMNMFGHPGRETVLMVGDSLSSDIRGGADAGIDTCWYNPHRAPCSEGLVPTYEIRTLQELRQLL
jgi:YjjG family noncanonical pyrimidine nucleotidase